MFAPLNTKHLILRNWTDADAESFAEMNADPRVMVKDGSTFEHPAVPAGHHLREHVLYRIIKGSALSR